MRSRPVGLLGALAWGATRAVRDRFEVPGPEPAPVYGDAPLAPIRPLRVLCWNLQYGAGRSDTFFYEGGPRVLVTDAERDTALAGIRAVLRDVDADIVVLQEVDVRSDRTGRVDQRQVLLDALRWPTWTSAPYHDVPFVPAPTHRPMGRVNVHLFIASKWNLAWATRHPLPLMAEPAWRRAFNLRRAVLEARIKRVDGTELALMNVHLSAFSFADGTLHRQVAVLDALCARREEADVPWVLLGDMNALPPGADISRLAPEHAKEYVDDPPPLAPLFARWPNPIPPSADPAVFGTYVPLGAQVADRAIDHVFHSPRVAVTDYHVITGLGAVSDHLPLVFSAR